MKRLYKDRTNGKLSGVLCGISEYFNVDPSLIRLGYVFIGLVTGVIPAIIFYVIAAAVLPEKSEIM